MKKMKLFSILALSFALVACGTAGTEDAANGNGEAEEPEVEETQEQESPATEEPAEEEPAAEEGTEEATPETDKEAATPELIKEEAAYVGQIDSNSIEVNTETQVMALRVDEVQNVDWGSIQNNALLIIEYYTNEHGQNILQAVEIKE